MYEDRMDILQKELEQKFDEGRNEGREEGRKSREIEVAKNLLKAGVSLNIIAESTGLPEAEIAQLKKEKPLS